MHLGRETSNLKSQQPPLPPHPGCGWSRFTRRWQQYGGAWHTQRAAWTSLLLSPQYFSSCQPLGPGKKSPCPTWWPAGARSSEHGPGMLPGNMVISQEFWPSLMAQTVKNLPAMQETQVGSLGQEEVLEESRATHSSILAWRIP